MKQDQNPNPYYCAILQKVKISLLNLVCKVRVVFLVGKKL